MEGSQKLEEKKGPVFGIISYCVERPLLVNLVTVLLMLLGGMTIYSIKKEAFPLVEFEHILISTSYPGGGPEDVENFISIPLEREVREVEGVEEVNTLSLEGSSVIDLKIDPDEDLDEVLENIKSAVDNIQDLPEESERPFIRSIENSTRPILKIALTGKDEGKLRELSTKMRDALELIPGVAKVDRPGYRPEEIRVEVDLKSLSRYQLTLGEIRNALVSRHINLSAGNMDNGGVEFFVRTRGQFKGVKDIEELVLRSNSSGEKVLLKEVAEVVRDYEEVKVLERSYGKPAILLDIKKKFKGDIIQVDKLVKEKVEDFNIEKNYPGINYYYLDDISFFVKRRLGILTNNGMIGLVLVFFCLMLFLDFRTSLLTSIGAPLAFMCAFLVMEATGITLNLISMFGLILVLGMLVDDAIIVAEYFYQLLEEGEDPKKAAIKAAVGTVRPVLATIITTMLAFSSLFFMGGIMGKFLWSVPAVVCICLAASFFECFFILPSHLADFSKRKKKGLKERRWYAPLLAIYKKTIEWSLKRSFTMVLLFWVLFGTAIIVAKNSRFELFPSDDSRFVVINLKGKVGDTLEVTEKAVARMEKVVLENIKGKKELEALRAIVGKQFSGHSSKRGSHYGAALLYLTLPADRKRSTDAINLDLTEKVKAELPGHIISSTIVAGGPPKGKPVEVEFSGPNLSQLLAISKKVKSALDEIPGVLTSEIDFEEGKFQYVVEVLEREAKRLGVSTVQVAREVRLAFAGDPIGEIRAEDEDIDIKLRLSSGYRKKLESIKKLLVLNNEGRRVPLARMIEIKKEPGAFVIRRFNGRRTISVSGNLNRKITTPLEVAKALGPKVDDILKNYPLVSYQMGGENKETEKSMVRLARAAMMALSSIFLVLVAIFASLAQPLVIMSAIPLGLVGVIFSFKVLGMTFGFMALMGVVGLIGVVVNDSIVLVNFINEKKKNVDCIVESIVQAAVGRFRAVILTTFTTVAGLWPVAGFFPFNNAKNIDPFLRPMAASFATGLLFATFVTLIFIPCSYHVYYKSLHYFKGIKIFKNKE